MGTPHTRWPAERTSGTGVLIGLYFRKPSWFRVPNHHQGSGLWVSDTQQTNLEGVTYMFLGPWCGQLGVGGWVLIGLFWATFVGLVLWAMSRLFAPR